MAHHQPDRDAVEGIGFCHQSVDLDGRQPKPRHATVDLQRCLKLAAGALGGSAPGLDLLDAVQHGYRACRDADIFGTGRNAVEDVDFYVSAKRCA